MKLSYLEPFLIEEIKFYKNYLNYNEGLLGLVYLLKRENFFKFKRLVKKFDL